MRYALSALDLDEIVKRFTYHPPFGDQTQRYQRIRDRAHALALDIKEATPPSREQALALTKLEEAVMWANASIARNEEPPEDSTEPAATPSSPVAAQ